MKFKENVIRNKEFIFIFVVLLKTEEEVFNNCERIVSNSWVRWLCWNVTYMQEKSEKCYNKE